MRVEIFRLVMMPLLAWSSLGLSSELQQSSYLDEILAPVSNRCLLQPVPFKTKRHGLEAQLFGVGKEYDFALGWAKLGARDRAESRLSTVVLSESFLNQISVSVFKSFALAQIGGGVVQLKCKSPLFQLGAGPNPPHGVSQRIDLSISCDSVYGAPFNSSCQVSAGHPCTGIAISVTPKLMHPGTPEAHIGLEWALNDVQISLPALSSVISGQVAKATQDIERFTGHLKVQLLHGESVADVSDELMAELKYRYSRNLTPVLKLESELKDLKQELPVIAQMAHDAQAIHELIKQVIPANIASNPAFAKIIQSAEPQIALVLQRAEMLDAKMQFAIEQIDDIKNRLSQLESSAELQVEVLKETISDANQMIVAIQDSAKQLEFLLGAFGEIGTSQDANLANAWVGLIAGLKQQLNQTLPHSFELLSAAPFMEKFIVPGAKAEKVEFQIKLGVPRVVFSGEQQENVIELPIITSPIQVHP